MKRVDFLVLVNSPDCFLDNYWCSELQALKSQMIGDDSSERSVRVGTLSGAVIRSTLKLPNLWHKHDCVMLVHFRS